MGPKGIVFSPRSQAMKFSLARTSPSACTERMAGAQRVNHLVGAVGLGGDFRVEPEQRLAQPRFHHHIAGLTRNLHTGNVIPTRRLKFLAERSAGRLVVHRFNGAGAAQILDGIENHLLDGVGFVEAHDQNSVAAR